MDITDIGQMQWFQLTPQAADVSDLIHYWAKRLDSLQISQRASIALTFHSIPAMSSEVESEFRSSKLLISNCHNQQGNAVISAVECLKSWEWAGIFDLKDNPQLEDLLVVLEKRKK